MVVGTTALALVGAGTIWRITSIVRAERSDARAVAAAARLLRSEDYRRPPERVHPDQDCTGDMPPKSAVRAAIEEVQARSYQFGGDQHLRNPSRWKARFHEPRPEPVKRDWL
jgi:hypothetical protein